MKTGSKQGFSLYYLYMVQTSVTTIRDPGTSHYTHYSTIILLISVLLVSEESHVTLTIKIRVHNVLHHYWSLPIMLETSYCTWNGNASQNNSWPPNLIHDIKLMGPFQYDFTANAYPKGQHTLMILPC